MTIKRVYSPQHVAERIALWDEVFDVRWQIAASEGRVDALGGAEYRRRKARWIADGRPGDDRPYMTIESEHQHP